MPLWEQIEEVQLYFVVNALKMGQNILQFLISKGHLTIGANLYIC